MCLFVVATAVLVVVPHHATAQNPSGAVFAMTNAASNNQINAYTRREDGSLQFSAAFSPGGNGIGGTVDPLHSQGSLALGTNHSLPVCRERGQRNGLLVRRKRRQSLAAQYCPHRRQFAYFSDSGADLVYVLNSGGNGSVSGFRLLSNGHLLPIPNSTRRLTDSASKPTDGVLSPNGQFLIVAESAVNKIDVFHVLWNGTLSNPVVSDSTGAGPFAAVFTPGGALIVANA